MKSIEETGLSKETGLPKEKDVQDVNCSIEMFDPAQACMSAEWIEQVVSTNVGWVSRILINRVPNQKPLSNEEKAETQAWLDEQIQRCKSQFQPTEGNTDWVTIIRKTNTPYQEPLTQKERDGTQAWLADLLMHRSESQANKNI